jgi:predicted nucleic acid-binding protein
MYLLDTNVVIDYFKAALPEKSMQLLSTILDEQPVISVITQIEVLGFNNPNVNEVAILSQLVQEAEIINLTNAVINQTIELRKQYRIKLPDAIIAATAIALNLTLVTRNISDFSSITGLIVINPYDSF